MRTTTHPLLSTVPSVLVIGKESPARARLHRALGRARFRAFVCAQLRDAIELMQYTSVVVCQQPLPGVDWKTVLEQAERLRYPPSVVVTIPRPLTVDLDEANQTGVFTLLEPFQESDLISFIIRAHTEYQTVRDLQSIRPAATPRSQRVRALARCGTSESRAVTRWTEAASTASFRTPGPPGSERTKSALRSVSGG